MKPNPLSSFHRAATPFLVLGILLIDSLLLVIYSSHGRGMRLTTRTATDASVPQAWHAAERHAEHLRWGGRGEFRVVHLLATGQANSFAQAVHMLGGVF